MQKVIVTGENGALSLAVAAALKQSDLQVKNLGLRNGKWETESFKGYKAVVHVAGLIPKPGVEPGDFYRVNTELTKALAAKAKTDGVEQFVYISSMAVYGVSPTLNKKKGTVCKNTPCAPTGDYGKSKLLAEQALESLKDESFRVAAIRVPSIYGIGKTEYFETYRCFVGRFKKIPNAYTGHYKSIICVENLCRLICLIVQNGSEGIFCPDDGKISTVDLCRALMPEKKTSRLLGALVCLFGWNRRVKEYYGSVCYDSELTNVFGGAYRVCDYQTMIGKINHEK